jgi:hypothetical protein
VLRIRRTDGVASDALRQCPIAGTSVAQQALSHVEHARRLLPSRQTRQVTRNRRLALTGPRLLQRRTRDLHVTDASDGSKIDRWNSSMQGHVVTIRAIDAGGRVCCKGTTASGDLEFWNNGYIQRGTYIYSCWPALGSISWHFDILVSILS